jgi:hypothetical protein
VPSGGSVTTIYNEHDQPAEAQIRDSDGGLVSRLIRSYDTNGHILGDKLATENAGPMLPEELKSKLNDAQQKAVANFMAGGLGSAATSYRYDDQGRLTERRRTGLGDEVTTISYNSHGDKSDQRTVTTPEPAHSTEFALTDEGTLLPAGASPPPQPPSRREVHYEYQYDLYGNWIEQTSSQRSRPDDPFKPSSSLHRKLTYY